MKEEIPLGNHPTLEEIIIKSLDEGNISSCMRPTEKPNHSCGGCSRNTNNC